MKLKFEIKTGEFYKFFNFFRIFDATDQQYDIAENRALMI